MKKLSLAILLASGLVAAENGGYVGFDIGNSRADFTATNLSTGATASTNDNGGSQTLKVGYYFNANNRVAAFYQNINVDDGSGSVVGIGYDYLFGNNDVKPFVGAILGRGSNSYDSTDNIPSIDISGMVYGAQIGLNYSFNENFSVEAGYRYLGSNMEDTINVSGTNVKLEVDNISNWYVGLNYRF